MPPPLRHRTSAAQRTFLDLLADPARASALTLPQWEMVIRHARMARLLATLRHRIEACGALAAVPEPALRHMDSDAVLTRHRRQMMVWQMSAVTKMLAAYDGPVVWLKGASYVAQNLPIAEGRLPADVDFMVPRARLDEVERLLRAAGWKTQELSEYDERYYRDWGHELPPMQHGGLPMELDVHHTILPVTGRVRPNAQALIADSVALAAGPIRVLNPHDQVLHAASQLFQDSDCDGRLRDLVDFDGLIRFHSRDAGFWEQLPQRAVLHQLERSLWYALRYASAILRTPVPAGVMSQCRRAEPPYLSCVAMDRLVPDALLPGNPDIPATRRMRFAKSTLLARSVWLRMPPSLLARHLWHKASVGWRSAREQQESQV